MTCAELTEFLSEYLDDKLPPDARVAFERHLAVCPECRAYLHSYKMAIALGQSALLEPPSDIAAPPAKLIAAILASRPVARDVTQ